jgi:hypothetical protein
VIDGLGATMKVAELLVELRRASGLASTRRGYFGSRPPARLVERARRSLGS